MTGLHIHQNKMLPSHVIELEKIKYQKTRDFITDSLKFSTQLSINLQITLSV